MMLSLESSAIEKRRQLHRRQNSTPTMFEPAKVPELPNIPRRTNHRRGLSLDPTSTFGQHIPDPMYRAPPSLLEEDSKIVSITNNSGTRQQPSQETQQDRLAQPGLQYPQTPTKRQPSEQEITDLKKHIASVYGGYGTVFVNILPTPVATPQKPAPLPENLDLAPMPSSFNDVNEISLDLPPLDHGLSFNFENPESDLGYESSYYSSEALSPGRSPTLSPEQKSVSTFAEPVTLGLAPQLSFNQGALLMPTPQGSQMPAELYPPSSPMRSPRTPRTPRSNSIADIVQDAIIEDTGIAPEDVQAYISEQNADGRWTCLFPGCNKTFGRRENIRSHVQTHLGDRQYRCRHCNKCFVRQHDLRRHAKIHSGVKPFKCPCGGDFARQDALTRHRQRGMCIGAFPNCVRKSAPRGRPKKIRAGMEDRLDKARKTRKALASSSASSSGNSSATSPASDSMSSPATSDHTFDACSFQDLLETPPASSSNSFNTPPISSNPYTPPTSPPPCSSLDDMFTNIMTTFDSAPTLAAQDLTMFSSDPFIADSPEAYNDLAWMDSL